MAYEYKKLSEVEVADVVDSSVNLIVETNDEIKKLNIGDLPIGAQEQADWNEEDATKASYIKNKPDLSQVGGSGGGTTIVNFNAYYPSGATESNMTFEDTGEPVTLQRMYESLLNGRVLFKIDRPASSELAPQQEYYPAAAFYHYDDYTYTNMSGFTEHSPERIIVCVQVNSSTWQSYNFYA